MSYKQKDDYDMIYGWSIDRAIEIRKANIGLSAFTVDDVLADAKKLIEEAKNHILVEETVQ